MNIYRTAKPHRGNFDFEVDFHEANVEFLRDQHEEAIREKLEAERQSVLDAAVAENNKQIDLLDFDQDHIDSDIEDEELAEFAVEAGCMWGNYLE